MSDEKLLGEMIAFRKYTETRLDAVEEKLDVLIHWKLRVMGGAAVIAAIVTYILKGTNHV